MRAACCVSVYPEVNQNMIKALAEARLLHGQIAAQPVAIRMPFARCVVPMPIGRRIVIVIAASVRSQGSRRPVASNCVVQIMPATSKQCMDEQ
jgi:hypothetical protein